MVMRLVNWVERIRVDKPDMRGILDEVAEGFKQLSWRILDRENNGILTDLYGGHVVHGFNFDFDTFGVSNVQIGNGVYMDQNGVPIYVPDKAIDLSPWATGNRICLWAKWSYVETSLANRVFHSPIANDEELQSHFTREDVQVVFGASSSILSPPPGLGDWTLLLVMDKDPGDSWQNSDVFAKPNIVFGDRDSTEPSLGLQIPALTDVTGWPIWGTLEKIRREIKELRGTDKWDEWNSGTPPDTWSIQDLQFYVQDTLSNVTDLQNRVTELEKNDVRAAGEYNHVTGNATNLFNSSFVPIVAGHHQWDIAPAIPAADMAGRGPVKVNVQQIFYDSPPSGWNPANFGVDADGAGTKLNPSAPLSTFHVNSWHYYTTPAGWALADVSYIWWIEV